MRPGIYLTTLLASAAVTAIVVGLVSVSLARRPAPDRYVLERKIAATITEGQTVAMGYDLNFRMLRWSTADQMFAAPEVAIMGSSHSWTVGADDLGPLTAMNFSVQGGLLADHMVTTGILWSRKLYPKHWVIFVDPWLFDADFNYDVWRQRSSDLLRAEERLANAPQPAPRPFTGLVAAAAGSTAPAARYDLEPILLNADAWLNQLVLHVHVTNRTDLWDGVIRPDGARKAERERRVTDPGAVKQLALRQYVQNTDRLRYGIYRQIDESLWDLFAAWVRTNRADGARIWLVLPPYHPAIYPQISSDPNSQLAAIESRVRALATEAGITVTGDYDPVKAGIPGAGFYDGDHLIEPGLKRLLAPIRQMLTDSSSPLPASTRPYSPEPHSSPEPVSSR